MTIIKRSIFLLILVVSGYQGFSQPGQGKRKQGRMEALNSRRVAFITERMSLTPEEAQVFWPLYNEFIERRDGLMHDQYSDGGKKAVAEMSKSEAEQFAEDEVQRLEEAAVMKREFHEGLKDILTIEKIAKLYEAERDFNKMIFREARQGRGSPQNRK